MDEVVGILGGIVEAIVRLLYGVIRLIIRTIGLLLSRTWIARHFGALRRFGWWMAAVMAGYLVFGILRAMVEPLWTPGLTPLYQAPIVALAMLLLLVGIAMRELDPNNFVPDTTHFEFEPDRPVATKDDGPIQTQPTAHSAGLVAGIVLAVLILGLVSALTSERHEATLMDKLCAQADARISDSVEQRVRDGAGIFDRVFGTQTANRIPCDEN